MTNSKTYGTAVKTLFSFLCIGCALCASAANLIPGDSSFEINVAAVSDAGTAVEAPDAPDGKKVLLLNKRLSTNRIFTFKAGVEYVFSLYMKAENAPTQVMLQAYRTNWDGRFATSFVQIDGTFRRYELHIPPQKAGDINTFWLIVAPQNGVSIQIDALQLEEGGKATAYNQSEAFTFVTRIASPVPGNLFLEGENVDLRPAIRNNTGKTENVFLSHHITDYNGKDILKERKAVHVPAGKSVFPPKPEFPSGVKGIFFLDTTLEEPDGTKHSRKSSFCVLSAPGKRDPSKIPFFGIYGPTLERIPAAARMGTQIIPLMFRWDFEQKDGSFHPDCVAVIDRLMAEAQRNGMEVSLSLDRTPPWAATKTDALCSLPPKEQFIPRYEDFAFKVAKRYGNRVRIFQPWGGEVDLSSERAGNELGMKRSEYAALVGKLCQAAYRGVKRAKPDAIVESPSVSGVDCDGFPFLRQVVPHTGNCFDTLLMHPYTYPQLFEGDKKVQSPEEKNLPKIYREGQKLAGGKNVCANEYGFAIAVAEPYDSAASKRMGDYLARSFLLTAATPGVSRLMYYTMSPNDLFSIWDWPNPRPAVAAYSTCVRMLARAFNGEEFQLGASVRGCVFTSPEGSRAALWVANDKSMDYTPSKQLKGQWFDLMGNELGRNGNRRLSGSPLFLCSKMPAKELKQALLDGVLHCVPVTCAIRVKDPHAIQLFICNQTQDPLDAKLRLMIPTEKGTKEYRQELRQLRFGINERITVKISDRIKIGADRKVCLTGQITSVAGTLEIKENIELLLCSETLSKIQIDGDLSEWKNVPPIVLNSTGNLIPPDAFSHGLWKNAADLSVTAYTGYDTEYFYFAAHVTDDVFTNNQAQEMLWNGDCLQLAFDRANDVLGSGYTRTCSEYTVAFSPRQNGVVVLRSQPPPQRIVKSVKAAVKRGNGFIDYEVAIPFRQLAPLSAKPGQVFGFNFVVLDADTKNVDYGMGLSYGIFGGKDASLFKKFILTPKGNKR